MKFAIGNDPNIGEDSGPTVLWGDPKHEGCKIRAFLVLPKRENLVTDVYIYPNKPDAEQITIGGVKLGRSDVPRFIAHLDKFLNKELSSFDEIYPDFPLQASEVKGKVIPFSVVRKFGDIRVTTKVGLHAEKDIAYITGFPVELKKLKAALLRQSVKVLQLAGPQAADVGLYDQEADAFGKSVFGTISERKGVKLELQFTMDRDCEEIVISKASLARADLVSLLGQVRCSLGEQGQIFHFAATLADNKFMFVGRPPENLKELKSDAAKDKWKKSWGFYVFAKNEKGGWTESYRDSNAKLVNWWSEDYISGFHIKGRGGASFHSRAKENEKAPLRQSLTLPVEGKVREEKVLRVWRRGRFDFFDGEDAY